MNRVILMGNLTRDTQTRQLKGGNSITEFGIAVSEKWKDKASGEMKEKVCFADCKCWGKQGDVIAKFFKKGNPILLEGSLIFETWDAKEGGGKRSKLSVNVDHFEFVGSKRESQDSGPAASVPAPEEAPFGESDIPF